MILHDVLISCKLNHSIHYGGYNVRWS